MGKQILAVTVATLAISGCTVGQTPSMYDDHSAHHPTGREPVAEVPVATSRAVPTPEAFDRQMNAMREMHQRMQSANTPAERANLMAEHKKLMHSGIGMMGQMRAAGGMPGMMSMHLQLERRMAMMEQMMQMMVDRLPPAN